MRLVTFLAPDGVERWGILRREAGEELIVDPRVADPDGGWPGTLAEQLARGTDALAAVRTSGAWRLPEVTLLAPVPRPGLCWGLVTNSPAFQRRRTDLPILNLFPLGHQRPLGAVVGAGSAIPLRHGHHLPIIGFNVELGVVIGRGGRRIAAADALDHVAGYTVVTDVAGQHHFRTAPGHDGTAWHLPPEYGDWLAQATASWGGKIADGHAPIGPWLVTRDEVPDPYDLLMWTRQTDPRTGDTTDRDRAHSGATILGIERVIEWYSSFATLHPGDIIHFGTMGVDGLPLRPKELPVAAPDSEIERVGRLVNPAIVRHRPLPAAEHPSPAVREAQTAPLADPGDWSPKRCRHLYVLFGEHDDDELEALPTPRFLLAPGASVAAAGEVTVPARATDLVLSVELAAVVGRVTGGAANEGFDRDALLGFAPMIALADQSFAQAVVEPARSGERGAPAMYARWADGFNVLGPISSGRRWRERAMVLTADGARAETSTSGYTRAPEDVLAAIAAMTTLFPGDVVTLGAAARIRIPRDRWADGLDASAEIEGLGSVRIRLAVEQL
ncbi:MAG: fumarylacetoacetate hydrolase family protein [Microbacterium sp.]